MTVTFDPERHCGALRKQTGEPCKQWKGQRTDHKGAGSCWLHGGRTPNGKKHSRREMAAKTLSALAIPVAGDPIEVLQAAVASAYGVLLASRNLLATKADPEYAELYLASIERASRVAKGAADAGIDAAMVRIAERQAEVTVRAVQTAIETLIATGDRQKAEAAAAAVLEATVPVGAGLN